MSEENKTKNPPIKAVFLDIDNTIYSHYSKTIPESTFRAIEAARANGIKVFMATVRCLPEIEVMPVNVLKMDGYVLMNGQLCLDGDRQIVQGWPFEGENLKRLIDLFDSGDYSMEMMEYDRMYFNFRNECSARRENKIAPKAQISKWQGAPLYSGDIFITPEDMEEIEKRLGDGIHLTNWGGRVVEFTSFAAGKANGIAWWMDREGWKPEEIMTMGDAFNDVEMIKLAGTGVAMGNADECAKEVADYVTDHIDEDGLAKAFAHFGIAHVL